ncbi:uncharacterized protein LOC142144538 [Mixophyes fleayi]|uniref:uncharacterized protein LOC142144538 n=1 Tax=Mixophyes fleayi TaxID=3061075 RepID=UPI003F4DA9F6
MNASELLDPLYTVTKGNATGPITLTSEQLIAFEIIKELIASAPALGLSNYELPFNMFCHEQNGHAHGVLTQEHGGKQRPLAYYSQKLDPVITAAPTCIKAVAAAALLLQKVADIVLDHPLTIQVPHSVMEILNQARTKHISAARLTKYEVALLTPSNVTLKRCTVLNPATLLPSCMDIKEGSSSKKDGDIRPGTNDSGICLSTDVSANSTHSDSAESAQSVTGQEMQLKNFHSFNDHDCLALMDLETTPPGNVKETPLANPDLLLFVDGSRYYEEGSPKTGYAVTTETEILIQQPLPPSFLAQQAELEALISACQYAEGKTANDYTDSRYAFGVAHDYQSIWKNRHFMASNGKPIKNADIILRLFTALELPEEVAVIKIKAHTREQTLEVKGNRLTDQAAKAAADLPLVKHYLLTTATPTFPVDLEMLKILQKQATESEKEEWKKRGAEPEKGLWGSADKHCLPRALFPTLATLEHGPTHVSKDGIINSVFKHWIAPGFSTAASNLVKACAICNTNNPGHTVTVPLRVTPKPLYPFQRIQRNYCQK